MAEPWLSDPIVTSAAPAGGRTILRKGATPPAPPSGYRYTGSGDLEFIPNGPADPALKTTGKKTPTEAALDEVSLELKKRELAKADASQITPAKLHEVRIDAANKINTIRDIRRALHGMSLPSVSGAGLGDWLKVIPGTAARGLGAKLENLKAGGALAEVLKLSAATGRNPFTPMSNSDVDLISRNIGNLDQGQSADDLIKQLDLYEAAYGRGYMGAGGEKSRLLDRNRADGPFPGKGAAKTAKAKGGVKFLGFE